MIARLLLLFVLPLGGLLCAQDELVSIGQWRIHPGDNIAWAAPGFDDSGWAASTYPAPLRAFTFEPGSWWYRAVVGIPAALEGRTLALDMGAFNDVYEVYAEGVSIGRFGEWIPKPHSSPNREMVFAIPRGLMAHPYLHIAIRRWVGKSPTGWTVFNVPGMNSAPHAPELGSGGEIKARAAGYVTAGGISRIPDYLLNLLELLAAFVALALYTAQVRRTEYLYLALYYTFKCLPVFAAFALVLHGGFDRRSLPAMLIFTADEMRFVFPCLLLGALCPPLKRFLRAGAIVGAAGAVFLAAAIGLQSDTWSFFFRSNPIVLTLFVSPALIVLVRRRDRGAAWIAGCLFLSTITLVWNSFPSFPVLPFVGPFRPSLVNLTDVPFMIASLVVLYYRFRADQAERDALTRDFESAARMQASLLGGPAVHTPGLAVETCYFPAKEVGGDFYQFLPGGDGSLLVVGDVSGKGLDASMVVATMVGAISNEDSREPAVVLSRLNRLLLGRTNGGFVTCCCVRFEPNGRIVTASAGHLAPYLDGQEITGHAGLPLGIVPEAAWEESHLLFVADGQLTLISDGVVEAANSEGELFGFDRTRALSTQAARRLADAARDWGQTDDITVVTVRRSA